MVDPQATAGNTHGYREHSRVSVEVSFPALVQVHVKDFSSRLEINRHFVVSVCPSEKQLPRL